MSDEDISEWQQIPYSSSSTTTNINTNTQISSDEITTLPLIEDITIDSNNSNNDDEKGEYGNKWLKKSVRELSCWIVQMASKVKNYAASKVGIGKFTYNRSRILAIVLVSLFYWMIQKKWRRPRKIDDSTSKKLMLLVQEKDQKIEQLSLQINQMNESLLTRRKVPVLQVG